MRVDWVLAQGSHRNKVLGCEFYDVGANAVMLGYNHKIDDPPRRMFENDWIDRSDAPKNNDDIPQPHT